MLMHDDEVASFEPLGIVKVKGAPEAALPVHELVRVAIAFEPRTRHGLESLAHFHGRSSRLTAVGEGPDELEAERPVISLEDVDGLGIARLRERDPEAFEEGHESRRVVVDLLV